MAVVMDATEDSCTMVEEAMVVVVAALGDSVATGRWPCLGHEKREK
jgi:hypothetical protein